MNIQEYISQHNYPFAEYWNEIKLLLYAFFAYLNLNIDIAKVLIILMIIDTMLGSLKAIRLTKTKFTTKSLFWGVISKCTILLIPMILAYVALALGYDFTLLTDIVLKVLVVSEALSTITNILSIKEQKEIKNIDFVSKILYGIRRFLISKLEYLTKTIKDEE